MPVVERSVLTPYRPEQMYALVDDVESYPRFLPWCERAEVLAREPGCTRATLHVNFHGLRQRFTTENRTQPGERIDIGLVSGPFRLLQGHWRFTRLGEQGCRVDFRLEYEFSSRLLAHAAGPVFGQIASSFTEAFVLRAEQLYEPK